MASTAAVLNILVTANTSKANTALAATQGNLKKTATTASASAATVGQKWQSVGQKMKSVGSSMTRGVTVPVLAAGAVATKFALDFHDQMGQLENQAGATGKEVERMSKRVLALSESGKSTHGPRELATALFTVESAGLRGAKAMNVLRSAEQLATVGNAELEETVKGVTTAMKVGLKGTGSTKKAVGQLNAIIGQGRMRMDELNSAMGTGFLTSAKEVGISLAGVGAALATMTDQGIPAVKSAMSLRMMFKGLAAPTKAGEAAFKDIGLSVDDLAKTMQKKGLLPALQELQDHLGGMSKVAKTQFLAKAFGVKSSTAISVLLQNLDAMSGRQDNINKKAKEFGSIWRKEMKDPDSKLAAGLAKLETLMVKLGTDLLPAVVPALTGIADAVTNLFNAFNKLPGPVKQAGVYFVVLVAALGPLLTVIGGLTTALPALGTALTALGLTNPWVLLALAAAAAAFLIIKNWKQVKEFLGNVWGWTKDHWKILAAVFLPLSPVAAAAIVIATHWKQTKQVLGGVWSWIKGAAQTIFQLAGKAARVGLLGPIPLIISRWKDVKGVLSGAWGTLGKVAGHMSDAVLGAFKKMGSGIKKIASGIANAIGTVATVIKAVIGAIIRMVNKAVGALGGLKDKIPTPSLPDLTPWQGMAPGIQRGGMIPGAGVGDKVPAMLEPGEVVINRKAVAAMGGARRVNRVNQVVPRFAKGGTVGPINIGGSGALHDMAQGGTDRVRKAANAYIKKHSGAGKYGGSGKVWDLIRDAIGLGGKFGLSVSSLSRPGDSDSYHSGMGGHQAVDLSNGVATPQMARFYRAALKRYGKRIIEMFYDPIGSFDSGVHGGPIGGHSDHVHIAFQKGGVVGLQKGGAVNIGQYDRTYTNPAKTIPFNAAAAIAESKGLPGKTFAQIAIGESALKPGISSSDGGYGLWQMTPRVQSAETVAKWKRMGSYFNPLDNAAMGKLLYDSAGGISPWYGTGSVTGSNLHYSGKIIEGARGAGKATGAGSGKPKKLELSKKQKWRLAKLTKRMKRLAGFDLKIPGEPVLKLQGKITGLTDDAATYAELADRASALTDSEEGSLPAAVKGLTEEGWLQKQLDTLFQLRNTLIRAMEKLKAAKDRIAKKIARLKAKDLTPKERDHIQDRLRREMNKPKAQRDQQLIASLRQRLGADDRSGALFNAKAIAGLTDLSTTITTKGGELGEGLTEVHGLGSSMKIFNSRPPIGELGGSIFDVQDRIKDLQGSLSGSITDDSETKELTNQLLRQIVQRGLVGDAQKVFPNFAQLMQEAGVPFGGSFQYGGVVPGAIGQPMMIQAHGGETVAPVGAEPVVNVTFTGGAEFLRNFIKVEVLRQGKRDARGVGRTPGSAGSLRG